MEKFTADEKVAIVMVWTRSRIIRDLITPFYLKTVNENLEIGDMIQNISTICLDIMQ